MNFILKTIAIIILVFIMTFIVGLTRILKIFIFNAMRVMVARIKIEFFHFLGQGRAHHNGRVYEFHDAPRPSCPGHGLPANE